MTAPRKDYWLPFIGVLLAAILTTIVAAWLNWRLNDIGVQTECNKHSWRELQREVDSQNKVISDMSKDYVGLFNQLRDKQDATQHQVDRLPGNPR